MARAPKNLMDPETSAAIAVEVAEIRKKFTERSDLTREVATLLFFRYGIYPSAHAVYAQTSTGSMTDISRDLKQFWLRIQETGKGKGLQADLPADLLEKTSQVLSDIWALSLTKANESLEALREESTAEVARERASRQEAWEATEQHLASAEIARKDAAEVKAQSRIEIEEAHQLREAAQQQQAIALTEKETAVARISGAEAQAIQERMQREVSEQRFATELQALRSQAEAQAVQSAGELKFALRQIDAAREAERNLAEQLLALRQEREHMDQLHRTRSNELMEELGRTRMALGEARGQLNALEPMNHRLTNQLSDSQDRAHATSIELAECQAKLEAAQELISILKPAFTAAEAKPAKDETQYLAKIRKELMNHPTAFEIADLFSATLELSETSDENEFPGFYLGVHQNDEIIQLTPIFHIMENLDEFCRLNDAEYEAISKNNLLPETLFWQQKR